jgi:hypothetical protein
MHPSQVFAWCKVVREGNIEEAGCGSFDGVFASLIVTDGSRMLPWAAIGGGRMEIVLIRGGHASIADRAVS